MLSHLSIQLLLYGVNTNFATLIISLPLLRAYFRSFMGRNQFKKVRLRPLKKSEAEEVRQGKGVSFRRALHTFGTPCTLSCTPFFIEVCRLFFLFSLVYEPFPMLSRRPARHAQPRGGVFHRAYAALLRAESGRIDEGTVLKRHGRGRACPARGIPVIALLRESCGPGMPGPYVTAICTLPRSAYPHR